MTLKHKGQFKKGMIPWNKGRKGVQSYSWRRKAKDKPICKDCDKRLASIYAVRCKSCAAKKRITPEFIKRATLMGKLSKGKNKSEETKLKISLSRKGKGTKESHWNWQGGKSKIYRDKHSLNNPKYREWRTKVFERDNFKCRIENKDCYGQLEVHHILRWADFPELRYIETNGITLCKFHHPRKKKEEVRLSPFFRELINKTKC